MRMWKVQPSLLCDQHLLGEHCEMHMFLGTLAKKKKVGGYISKGLVEIDLIRSRHDELAKELTHRGMKHRTEARRDVFLWKEGKVDPSLSLQVLSVRCSVCRERISTANVQVA